MINLVEDRVVPPSVDWTEPVTEDKCPPDQGQCACRAACVVGTSSVIIVDVY